MTFHVAESMLVGGGVGRGGSQVGGLGGDLGLCFSLSGQVFLT